MAAKLATIYQFCDVTGWHLGEKMKSFPLKAKYFQNTATYKKPKEGGFHQPSPPLCNYGGMSLRVRPRVKPGFYQKIIKGLIISLVKHGPLNSSQ